MKLRRTTRSLLIVPYALPSFMTALIWQGLLNTSFGPINRMLGVEIPWLTSQAFAGALPKFSVILVNLWLGFGYMFLITTGCAAGHARGGQGGRPGRRCQRVADPAADHPAAAAGGGRPAADRLLRLQLQQLQHGLPADRWWTADPGHADPGGHTDILISFSYRLAFAGGRGQDFGLAAAISTIIFFLVAIFSYIGFKRTAVLEEIN
jgi:arabinogalactan oligomer / maltooligosaccharide transport system permease protein